MIRVRVWRAARVGRVLGVALGLLSAGGLYVSPGASAARSHAFSFSFGGAGVVVGEAGSLSLTAPAKNENAGDQIAINGVTHDLYVGDVGNHRVDEFTAAGEFVRAWGWGVATGASELQVCTSTCQPGLSGSEAGEFVTPAYVAVDNGASSPSKGDVYVGDPADDLVTKFDGEGKLISSWGNNGENASHEHVEPNGQLNGSPIELFDSGFAGLPIVGVGADESGGLWVYNKHRRLFEFKEDGTPVTACNAPLGAGQGEGGIVVNGGKIYVHDGFGLMQAIEPPPACTNPGMITSRVVSEGPEPAQGVAIDSSDGDFYVVRLGNVVEDIPGSCVPSEAGCPASQVFGEEQLVGATGIGIDPGSGAVFVANASTDQVLVFGFTLEATVGSASGVQAHTAVLHGSVDPVGSELSECVFEYGTSTEYGSSVPCAESFGAIGEGSSPVPVEADLAGLHGGTSYHFRLHAKNGSGVVYSEDGEFTSLPTAVIESVSTSEATTAGSIVLNAEVNPEGLAAHYHFEYGECAGPGDCIGSPFTVSTPEPDGEIQAGSVAVGVSQRIEGLSAGVSYHFRVVVDDVNGDAVPSPEGTFVIEPGLPGCTLTRSVVDEYLADCRSYEMVTPPEKDGALIANGVFIGDPAISSDGSRVISPSIQCFAGPQSCQPIRQEEGSLFSFHRTGAGWATEAMAPPASAYNTQLNYDADTNVVLYAIAAQPPGLEQFYAREPDGTFSAIGPIAETNPGAPVVGEITSIHRVATADLSRVVYEDIHEPWPSLVTSPTGKGQQIFEYVGVGNTQPMLVGVSGGRGSTSLISACATWLGGTHPIHSVYGSLSADGRTVFFTAEPCSEGTGANASVPVPAFALYERVEKADGEMKTVPVSASGPVSVCDEACRKQPAADASFEGASSNGSRVFFTDTQKLTNEASEDKHTSDSAFTYGCNATAPVTSGCNLYLFSCPSHCEGENQRSLIDVSAGDTSGLGPKVQGVVAIPPSGSDVYFVAQGVLTSKPNQEGQKAVPGRDNLYVYHAGENGGEGSVSFISTLATSDENQWDSGIGYANTTSDGRFLVFTSHRGLTDDTSREEGPAQVYRYDAQTEQLLRMSIGQAGFDDNGNASTTDASIAQAFRGFEHGVGPGRSDPTMSDNGEVVFFESAAGLTPGALNDHPVTGGSGKLAQNIYEWQADGARPSANAPVCAEPSGCVSLISDGKDLNEGIHHPVEGVLSDVELLGTDMSGVNVFFLTSDPLVGRDTDSQVDIYDARVEGGFPEPSVVEPCATLQGCRTGSSGSSGLFAAPASSVFAGPGNQLPPPSGGKAKAAPRSRSLSRAQRLRAALRTCHRKRGRARAACERRAHRRFGKAASGRAGR